MAEREEEEEGGLVAVGIESLLERLVSPIQNPPPLPLPPQPLAPPLGTTTIISANLPPFIH